MGRKAEEPLDITYEELDNYLRAKHSIYVELDGALYYLTDANDIYWRVQDTSKLNHKDHYTDCSELVPTLSEFMGLRAFDGKTIPEVFEAGTWYASIKD